ncbi:MAG TPA: glycosyltransferase family 1 protein [Mycobacteriales bacterium]|nr:glycosyltransferase family 1 protein [Mycobacteriales bacterium]
MRVGLIVEQLLAPSPGGTARYTREIARAVATQLAASGNARPVSCTAWHRDLLPAEIPGVAGPYRLPLGRRALAAAWERGIGPAPRGELDVVHAPTLLVPPKREAALVVTIHDAVPWTHPETLTPRGVAFHQRMAARAAGDADVVITVSRTSAAELESVLHLGDRLRVIPLGVSADLAVPADAVARVRRLGLPESGWFASVATLEPRKGLDVALAALAHPDAPDLPLAVAGSPGWGGVDLAAEARRLGLPAGRVIALGPLADADLAAVLGGAVALVAPARAEGFGLPTLEAMALGVPVVASDTAALVELAGGAVLHSPVGDVDALAAALAQVATDSSLRAELSNAGRRRAADFSWTRAGSETLAAYADARA